MGSSHSTESKKQGTRRHNAAARREQQYWDEQRTEQLRRAQREQEMRVFLAAKRDGGAGLSRTSGVRHHATPQARAGSRREQMLAEQTAAAAASHTSHTSHTAPSGARYYLVDPNKKKGPVQSRFHEEL